MKSIVIPSTDAHATQGRKRLPLAHKEKEVDVVNQAMLKLEDVNWQILRVGERAQVEDKLFDKIKCCCYRFVIN